MMIGNMYQVGFFFHMIGITLVVGTTFVNYVLLKKCSDLYNHDSAGSYQIGLAISKLPRIAGAGLGIQIISGFMMMTAVGGYGQQGWFKIKMGLVIGIIVIFLIMNRVLMKKLMASFQEDISDQTRGMEIQRHIGIIRLTQLTALLIFAAIFSLSVFKF